MKIPLYVFMLAPLLVWGQQPSINSISPTQVEVGQTVTISGSNLGGRGSSKVFFGGVESTGVTGTNNLLEATVPAGTTHGPITVLNTTNNLLAQSGRQFFISFSGNSLTSFDDENTTTTDQTEANDICLCDLDHDGLNDVIIAHSVNDQAKREISIFENQSNPSTTAFDRATNVTVTSGGNNAANLSGFIATACADLDNDGLQDLVFTTNQGTNTQHIYVYQNQSTPGNISMNYLSSVNLRLPNTSGGLNRVTRGIKAFDMDKDGKNDLIVGNDIDNTLHIYRNISSGVGTFNFSAPYEITTGNESSGVIAVADLNNDDKLDIISAPFRDEANGIVDVNVLKNNSIPGNLSFSFEEPFSNGLNRIGNLASGDFDDDGLNDIAIASSDGGTINVYRNTSSGSTISFVADFNGNVTGSPFGISLDDMNGDGDLDIVSSEVGGNILILENTSTMGKIDFALEVTENTATTTQNVFTGDLNGDAKPDIAYTTDVVPGATGLLGVFMNRNLIVPQVSPSSGTFCRNDLFNVSATKSAASSYTWTLNPPTSGPAVVSTTDNADITITSTDTPVEVQLVIMQTGSDATRLASVSYTILNGPTQEAPPIISDPGTVCAGDPLNLTLSGGGPYEAFEWTLPDGSVTTVSEINILSATPEDAGEYTVRAKPAGGCFTEISTRELNVERAPLLSILNQGCSGTDITLDIGGNSNFGYEWFRDGISIGQTTSTVQIIENPPSTEGTYTVEVSTLTGMCITTSEPLTVPVFPLSQFTIATETCVGSPIQLISTTINNEAFTLEETWEVLDGGAAIATTDTTQVGNDPLNFSFNTPGTYTVRLTSEYSDFQACPSSFERNTIVSPPPSVTFDAADGAQKCRLDALTVGVASPVAADIVAYQWTVKNAEDLSVISTSTDATVEAVSPAGVDSVYAVVTVTTDIGCQVTDSVRIDNFDSDIDISSLVFDLSNDIVTLGEDNSIVLHAENVASDLAWAPASLIDDTTATFVTVYPLLAQTTVTLSGIDNNGCTVASTVTIVLDNLRPRKTFSPNGDGLGFDCWEILNTADIQGCTVYIFDARGKNIRVEESPFSHNCVWDGNFSGSPAPEGVYYFVLKCENDTLSKSGSILLAR